MITTLLAVINFINKQTKKPSDESIGYGRKREQKIIVITFCILFAVGDKLYSSGRITKLCSL